MTETGSNRVLKLNYKRTFLIGFAFFGILLLWQVYDSWCPTFLTDIFARNIYHMTSAELKQSGADNVLSVQWIVGIIMACDNLAALILLPIFGSLSDKTKTPIGKRMPFILIGTMVAAIAFPFIPLFFHYNNIVGMVIMMAIVLMFMMMYRNPAVALMPDITPKPLRAKANGIINIMGYFGGAFATVLGIFLVLSKYITADDANRNLWTIELPFIIASVLMIISAFVLFFTIKENKLAEQLKDDMELGEQLAAIENPVNDDAPMSKANRNMLLAILGAEFLWFMADNALGTYINNYVIYYLHSASSSTMLMTIIGGVASVAGFAIAGAIADKIGRKWTISIGLGITVVGMILMIVQSFTVKAPADPSALNKFPPLLFVVWAIKGFGMALVHNCSFPMVVELCSNKKIGKFTGFYYAASMSAQTITPVLLGLFL
ncbi:MAG: MFS transporter, partial [Clostridia bacterium]|nr:MFS transporter [Clostridia bacterium]